MVALGWWVRLIGLVFGLHMQFDLGLRDSAHADMYVKPKAADHM